MVVGAVTRHICVYFTGKSIKTWVTNYDYILTFSRYMVHYTPYDINNKNYYYITIIINLSIGKFYVIHCCQPITDIRRAKYTIRCLPLIYAYTGVCANFRTPI